MRADEKQHGATRKGPHQSPPGSAAGVVRANGRSERAGGLCIHYGIVVARSVGTFFPPPAGLLHFGELYYQSMAGGTKAAHFEKCSKSCSRLRCCCCHATAAAAVMVVLVGISIMNFV